MKGALDKGRAFRTQQAKEQLYNLLLICLEEGDDANKVAQAPAAALKKYDLAKNPDKLVQDGWGEPFQIKLEKNGRNFKVTSKNLNSYNNKLKKTVEEPSGDEN